MILKFRSLASQLCGIFPYVSLQFTLGSFMGFYTLLIAEIYKKDSEIPTTGDQLSWFASLSVVKVIGSLSTGLLMHRLGCRSIALIAALIYIASTLMYYYSTNIATIFAGRTLGSLFVVYILCPPFISEISEPHLRGPLLAASHLSNLVGQFFSLLLGSLVYWRTITLVNLVFPILAAVVVLATPNSPAWLASKGRLDEAEKALCWLRGWVRPDQVQTEFRALVENAQKSKSPSNDKVLDWQTRFKNFFQLFLQRSFYLPLSTMLVLTLLYALGGGQTMEAYATVIFVKLNSPIEESLATAIMGGMIILGQLSVMIYIRRVGKRKLIMFSVMLAGFGQAVIAIFGFFGLGGAYSWIPVVAMMITSVAISSGVTAILFMLNSEIFPASVRYIGTSFSISFMLIVSAAMSKLFLYLIEVITLPGVFLFYAVVNFVSLVVYYFLFPETEGKTLKEIEDHFDGVKKLAKREKKKVNSC